MLHRLTAIIILIATAAACIAFDVYTGLSPGQLELRLRTEARRLVTQKVDFDSVSFSFREGLTVSNLKVGPKDRPILAVDKAVVKIDLRKQQIDLISIENPKIFLSLDANGGTNFDNLFASGGSGSTDASVKLPEIKLEGGRTRLEAQLNESEKIETVFFGIEASLKPESEPGKMRAAFIMHNKEIGRVSAGGTVSSDLSFASLKAGARDVAISSIKALLPDSAKTIFDDLGLAGNVDISARFRLEDGNADFEAEIENLGCKMKYCDFPTLVENIRGTIRLDRDGLHMNGLVAMTHGNPLTLDGAVVFGSFSPEVRLRILADDLKASEELLRALPEYEREIIADFAPQGQADITIDILKPAGILEASVNVRVDADGKASIAYSEFPYRLENLKGTLLVTPEQVEIRNITSVLDGQVVSGSGLVKPVGDGVEADIRIRGTKVRVDAKLREALTEEERETWDVFNPSGTASLSVEITSNGDAEEVDVDVKALFNGFAEVKPVPFPLRITRVKGMLHVPPAGGINISGIEGTASGGIIKVEDTTIPEGDKSEATIRAGFSQVQMGPGVADALASALEENLDEFEIAGLAEGEFSLHRPEGSENFELAGRVLLDKGELMHGSFPLKAENIKGLLIIKPDGYYIRNMLGTVADGSLEAWGEILDPPGKEKKIRMRFEGFGLLADEKLRNALPAELKATWDDFHPYGRMDAAVWLDGKLPFENISKILKLNLIDISGKYVEFPYSVTGISGKARADIDTGNIELRNLRTGDGKFKLSGSVARKEQHTITDVTIQAKSIELDNRLREAMPDEIKTLWKDIELGGSSSGTVKLHVYEPDNSESAIYYDILLRPEDMHLEAGFPIEKIKGKVTLKGHVAPNGDHELKKGLIQASNFTVNGLPVTWASLPLKLAKDSLTIDQITGKMANGTLSGMVKVIFDKNSTYAGSFELNDASVRLAAIELFGDKMEKTTGRASGWIRFQGEGANDNLLRGKGEFSLTKSNLWEVPFFSAIVNQLSIGTLPKVDFSESSGHFNIRGDHLRFDKVYFHSSVMNLDGTGELYFDGKIDFIFRMSLISKLIPIPGIQEILSRLEGEINAIRAQGTARKVNVTLAPKEALKAIKWLDESKEK